MHRSSKKETKEKKEKKAGPKPRRRSSKKEGAPRPVIRVGQSEEAPKKELIDPQKSELLYEEWQGQEREERDKKLIMWSGVTFFMILILAVWAFNVKNSIKASEPKNNGQDINWVQMTEQLNQTMQEMKKNLADLKNVNNAPAAPENAAALPPQAEVSSSTSTLPTNDDKVSPEEILKLKTQLEKLK